MGGEFGVWAVGDFGGAALRWRSGWEREKVMVVVGSKEKRAMVKWSS